MRCQGLMAAPSSAVIVQAALKEMRLGLRLTSAFTGATTLAAMLVLSVASRKPAQLQLVAQLRLRSAQDHADCCAASAACLLRDAGSQAQAARRKQAA